jgi:hypothetical protein
MIGAACVLFYQHPNKTRALELAARATELEPDEPRWWRIRTILEAWVDSAWDRPEMLVDVVRRAGVHDPDNGLYDYLLSRLEESGAADPNKLAEAGRCFDRAQQKPFVAVGDPVRAMYIFLEKSTAPRYTHPYLIGAYGFIFYDFGRGTRLTELTSFADVRLHAAQNRGQATRPTRGSASQVSLLRPMGGRRRITIHAGYSMGSFHFGRSHCKLPFH